MQARHSHIAALLAAAFMFVAGARLGAQTVQGKVLELNADKPVADAAITLLPAAGAQAGQGVRSGNDGSFTITAPAPGIYRFRIDKPGYRTLVTPAFFLAPNDRVNMTLRLSPDVAMLTAVQIVSSNRRPPGRANAFYERMRQRAAFGRFISRDEIERQRPIRVSDLLRTVPGLVVVPSAYGDVVRTTEGCIPDVYLDGLSFPLAYESIDDIVSPNMLEGIEVYAHPTEVPAEFQRPGSSCGAIVLWTHAGA